MVMRSDLLGAGVTEELRAAPFTYAPVGGTRGPLPAGYEHVHRDVTLGSGRAVFTTARAALLGWHVHRQAGVKVNSSSLGVEPDTVAVVKVGIGPVALRAPVRIVYLIDEPDEVGFAYGTLPGHPEAGEECFSVTLEPDETVRFRVTSFSRPATRLAQGSGSLGRALQTRITERYVDAMLGYCRPEMRRG
jgi:uncharacterized protein (UPF0548 family)